MESGNKSMLNERVCDAYNCTVGQWERSRVNVLARYPSKN